MIVSLLTINFCHLALLPLNGGIIRSSSSMMVDLHRFLSSLRKLSSLFFPGQPIFQSFLGRLGSNIKSNQIKNDYIVILFCHFFFPVCKQSAQGRKLGLFTAPSSLPPHSVRPQRAILGEPAVCSIALSTPSSGCNCCKCCKGSS